MTPIVENPPIHIEHEEVTTVGGDVTFIAAEIIGAGGSFPGGILTVDWDNFIGTPRFCEASGTLVSGTLAGYNTLGIATWGGAGNQLTIGLRVPVGELREDPRNDYFTTVVCPDLFTIMDVADCAFNTVTNDGFVYCTWDWFFMGTISFITVGQTYTASFLPYEHDNITVVVPFTQTPETL